MIEKYVFIASGLVLALLIFKRLFFNKSNKEYDKMYQELLTSKKYKVKGQYD